MRWPLRHDAAVTTNAGHHGSTTEKADLLARLGLARPELRAWAMYDWANSVFYTTVITAVFPVYYETVIAAELPRGRATSRYAIATSVALAIVALLAPVLGLMADRWPLKKRMLGVFLGLGVSATAALCLLGEGDWGAGLVVFGLGNIGAAGSLVFYDSLLPHIAAPHEIDRVSTAGYALGYLGGGLLLALNLLWIQKPGWFGLPDAESAVRLSFASAAAWWLLFSLPLFRRVPEPPAEAPGAALPPLRQRLRELLRYRQAFRFLLAFLLFNDGIQTIMRVAVIFGSEIGLGQGTMIGAILAVQFIGVPCAFLFGQLAGWIGTKRAILVGIAVYACVSALGYVMHAAWQFWALAVLVGLVQGGTQALSRSLFASMIPAAKSAELFGLFAVFEKFAGIVGPSLFALVVTVTGSSRDAVLAVIVFFVLGAALLLGVDVEAGRSAARATRPSLRAG